MVIGDEFVEVDEVFFGEVEDGIVIAWEAVAICVLWEEISCVMGFDIEGGTFGEVCCLGIYITWPILCKSSQALWLVDGNIVSLDGDAGSSDSGDDSGVFEFHQQFSKIKSPLEDFIFHTRISSW